MSCHASCCLVGAACILSMLYNIEQLLNLIYSHCLYIVRPIPLEFTLLSCLMYVLATALLAAPSRTQIRTALVYPIDLYQQLLVGYSSYTHTLLPNQSFVLKHLALTVLEDKCPLLPQLPLVGALLGVPKRLLATTYISYAALVPASVLAYLLIDVFTKGFVGCGVSKGSTCPDAIYFTCLVPDIEI